MRDRFDLPLSTTSSAARDAYVAGVDLMLAAQVGAAAQFTTALAADEGFALAHAGLARVAQSGARMDEARAHIGRAEALAAGASARERGHVAVIKLAVHGQGAAAYAALLDHLKEFPRDGVPLSVALGVYGLLGFSGRIDFHEAQRALLDDLAACWGDDWWFLAYHGWSMIETGDIDEGAALNERALALRPDFANARHVRAHAHFERGAIAEGAEALAAWLPGYDRAGVLHGHLHWHWALFELDRGAPERALSLFHDAIRPPVVLGAPLPRLADAASFLWRWDARGHPAIADAWSDVAGVAAQSFKGAGLAFADLHAAMAAAAIGDHAALDRRVGELEGLIAEGRMPAGAMMVPVTRALGAFARGDCGLAADLLDGARDELARIGGSHAQREVFEDTLIVACLRAGRLERARALLAERLARRPRAQDSRWLATARG